MRKMIRKFVYWDRIIKVLLATQLSYLIFRHKRLEEANNKESNERANLLKLNFHNKNVSQFASFSIAKWNLGNRNKLQSEGKTSVLIMKIKNVWLLYLGANNANIIF